MKVWIGAETQADAADSFRIVRNLVETSINTALVSKSYDIGVDAWDVIVVLRNDDVLDEICNYSAKKKEMDFRLKLDFRKFINGDLGARTATLFDLLCRSLDILGQKTEKTEGIKSLVDDVKLIATSLNSEL